MSKTKHTPGPWRKQGNLIFGKDPGVRIAQLFTQHIPGVKSGALEESANARLIAAAPEMFEALVRVLAWADPTSPKFSRDSMTEIVTDLRNAVAKARGES